MPESYPNGSKTLKNVKLLITSNFSFSQSVFKRLVLQTPKKQGLIRKLLRFTRTREQQITAWLSSIIFFMPLKHKRGMMASFYLKIMFFSPGIMFIITRRNKAYVVVVQIDLSSKCPSDKSRYVSLIS